MVGGLTPAAFRLVLQWWMLIVMVYSALTSLDAMKRYRIHTPLTLTSRALGPQADLQGTFIFAKAKESAMMAGESIDLYPPQPWVLVFHR
jgi:hypothetical protein